MRAALVIALLAAVLVVYQPEETPQDNLKSAGNAVTETLENIGSEAAEVLPDREKIEGFGEAVTRASSRAKRNVETLGRKVQALWG